MTDHSWDNIHVFMGLFKKFTFITDYPYFICIFSCLQSQVGKPAHSAGHSAFSRQPSFSIPANINLTVYIRNPLHGREPLGEKSPKDSWTWENIKVQGKGSGDLPGATLKLGQRDHPTTMPAREAGTREAMRCHGKADS